MSMGRFKSLRSQGRRRTLSQVLNSQSSMFNDPATATQ